MAKGRKSRKTPARPMRVAGDRQASADLRRAGPGDPLRDASPPSHALQVDRRMAGFAIAIIVLTFAVFAPAYTYDFSAHTGYVWDDDDHYLDDALIAAPDGWWRIWFDPQPGLVANQGGAAVWNYWPLTRASFWVDRHLFGEGQQDLPNLRASHLVNVALHAMNAALVFIVLAWLRVPGALLAGFLYAVHPITVESVAWLTERKNLLSTLCFLLALMAWLRFQAGRGAQWYGATVLAHLLALMAKTATVMFPVLLVLLHWYRREPITGRAALRLAPLFAMSLVAGVTSIVFEQRFISPGEAWSTSLGERIAGVGQIVFFYLGKLLYPVDLAFNYPRWPIDAGSATSYLATGLVLVGAIALYALRDRGSRALAFGLGAFVAGLFPVLGLFNVYGMRYARVADHWQYLPCVAVIALFAAGVATAGNAWAARRPAEASLARGAAIAVSILLVGALSWLTFQYSGAYRDGETLWRHTLAVRPDSVIAHNNPRGPDARPGPHRRGRGGLPPRHRGGCELRRAVRQSRQPRERHHRSARSRRTLVAQGRRARPGAERRPVQPRPGGLRGARLRPDRGAAARTASRPSRRSPSRWRCSPASIASRGDRKSSWYTSSGARAATPESPERRAKAGAVDLGRHGDPTARGGVGLRDGAQTHTSALRARPTQPHVRSSTAFATRSSSTRALEEVLRKDGTGRLRDAGLAVRMLPASAGAPPCRPLRLAGDRFHDSSPLHDSLPSSRHGPRGPARL